MLELIFTLYLEGGGRFKKFSGYAALMILVR